MPTRPKRWTATLEDICVSVLVVGCFSWIADSHVDHPGRLSWLSVDMRDHLGSEYHNIALALLDQRGFSDPFGVPTGATAWMPPVLPFLTAGIYHLVGRDQDRVVAIIYFLQLASMTFAGVVVLSVARRLKRYRVGLATLIAGFSTEFFFCFQMTHDVWLLMIVVNLLWLGICRFWSGPSTWSQVVMWGLFGGFSALCSPVMGATWAALTTLRWWNPSVLPSEREKRRFHVRLPSAVLTVAAIVSMLTITPWTVRNYRVLGQFIPIKSNAMFELWQSQVADDDGVFDRFTLDAHPNAAYHVRQEYVEEGEMPFIQKRSEEVQKTIRAAPIAYIERILNRFAVATIVYSPFDRIRESGHPWKVRLLQAAHPVTLACLFVCLVFRTEAERPLTAAIGIYFLSLLPYVLVSYYARYAAPLLSMRLLIVIYGIDTVFRRIAWLKTSMPPRPASC